jgi:cobalt-zinc-cadmium efflux system outer membrane protein
MNRLLCAGLVVGLASAGCAPTRQAMSGDVERGLPSSLRQSTRWLGADADKDAAVNDAVKRLLEAPLSPEAAAEIALVRHRRVQLAYESLGLAQADLVDAGLLSNPRLALAAHFHPDAPSLPPGLDVDVELPFLSVLFYAQRVSIAEARKDAALVRVIDEVVATAADARRAAIRAAAAVEVARLMRADLEAAEGAVLLTRENTKAGNLTPLDLAEEELRFQQALLATADAERDAAFALEQLKSALGLFGGEGVVQVLPLTKLSPLPVPGTDALVDVVGLEKLAVEKNLRLQAMQRDLDAAARELGYASVQRFIPDLDVGVVGEVDGSDVAVGPGVAVALPVLNLGQGEILRRESALRRDAAALQRAAVDLRAIARQAGLQAELTGRRAHQVTTRIIPQQLVVVDELERRLNGMIISPVRLFEGRRGFLQARRLETEALRDAWLARIDVEQLGQGGTPTPMAASTTTTPTMTAPTAAKGHD